MPNRLGSPPNDVQGDEAVEAVARGVLGALGHRRAGKLLEVDDELLL